MKFADPAALSKRETYADVEQGAKHQPWPFRVEAGHGRLYVSGNAKSLVKNVRGAVFNRKRNAYELSLTLETLKSIRAETGFSSQQLQSYCTPSVMSWATAAAKSEKRVKELHDALANGFRVELPWRDNSGRNRTPFEHQQVMATAACMLDGVAFLCEMGTAKTRSAIEAAGYHMRNRTIDIVIAVVPANVMNTWKREVNLWSDHLHPVLLEGAVKERIRLLEGIGLSGMRNKVVVINYEVLARMEDAIIALSERMRIGFIPDEMHRVRNPNNQVTKAAMRIAQHCTWRLGMTGSPILNGIENIWSQWYVIDMGVTFGANYVQFRREFFDESNYRFTHERNPLDDTASEVSMRIRKRALRYKKADCLDLPPKLYETKECEMTPEQTRAYNEMVETLIVRLRDMEENTERVATAPIQLTMMLRLSQITSGFLPLDEDDVDAGVRHVFEPNPKMDLLDELAGECYSQGQKFIVWARYRYDIETIAERLRAKGMRIATYYGGTTKAQRVEAEEMFQAGQLDGLVAHPASGGVGITLTMASMVFYYSQDYSLEHRLQSEDRCHRSGSEIHSAITYIDLICKGTIDEAVRAALESKLKTAEAVVEFRRQLEEMTSGNRAA